MPDKPPILYGGQAVIEGVMMRGRKYATIAVRAPSSRIVLRSERLPDRLYSGPVSRIPFVRGIILLWDTLGLGMKALMFSADVALEEENAQMSRAAKWTTGLIAATIAIGLFFLTPMFLAMFFERTTDSAWILNLIEGLFRLALLVAYVGLIGLMPDIRRVYMYHGAEHMTIHAFEHGKPLDTQEIARFPAEHPRCGTAFLLQVVAISVVVFGLVGNPDVWLRILSRIALIPVIAGIAYEILKLGARYYRNPLVYPLVAPGLYLQKLTTRPPDESQIEVALTAFKELQRIEAEAAENSPPTQPAPEPSSAS